MKLAFYYHITITIKDGIIHCPSYLGVFIDSLANEVEELYLVMHQANSNESKEADYALKFKNVKWINLGLKTPAWHRAIFHRRLIKPFISEINHCDAFIVRSPSPLAPYFHKYLNGPKLVFMIVGDYLESVAQWQLASIRDWFELRYLRYNDYMFRQAMRTADVLVNSPALLNKYKPIAKSVQQIRTTTISTTDFYQRNDTCQSEIIELLYTGRLDPLKGVYELLEAFARLLKMNFKIRLNIAGWELGRDNPVEKELVRRILKMGITDNVVFHGRKSVGQELNTLYRFGDIYVLPSHEEGFPRTIWEAMANSIPVITTDVGGIPSFLTHNENVIMIKPKHTKMLTEAIIRVIEDSELRQKLINNGFNLAKQNTLEIQSKRMVNIIGSLTNE